MIALVRCGDLGVTLRNTCNCHGIRNQNFLKDGERSFTVLVDTACFDSNLLYVEGGLIKNHNVHSENVILLHKIDNIKWSVYMRITFKFLELYNKER